jgi:hypothetical protein
VVVVKHTCCVSNNKTTNVDAMLSIHASV